VTELLFTPNLSHITNKSRGTQHINACADTYHQSINQSLCARCYFILQDHKTLLMQKSLLGLLNCRLSSLTVSLSASPMAYKVKGIVKGLKAISGIFGERAFLSRLNPELCGHGDSDVSSSIACLFPPWIVLVSLTHSWDSAAANASLSWVNIGIQFQCCRGNLLQMSE
jgi:hypothetical protein